jgi:polyisoprenoid-binding protein YceI
MSVIDYGIATGTWQSDPVHSSVGFAVRYLGVSAFKSEFKQFDVALDTTADEPKLAGTVEAASIVVDDENFHAHLLSPDFFDVQNTPQVKFESTGFNREGDILEVPGNLTIRGITQPVVTKGEITEVVTDAYGNERIGVTLSTKVDRTAYGLNWNMDLPKGGQALANEVTLTVDLSLVKKGE